MVPSLLLAQSETLPAHVFGNMSTGLYDATDEKWNWTGIGVFTATAASSYLVYRLADPLTNNPSNNPDMGEVSRWLTLVGRYTPYALPVTFFSVGQLLNKENPSRRYTLETAEQLTEAIGFTMAATYTLKYSVGRERPDSSNSRSFPSGHASMNFAAAGILAYRYPWYVGLSSLLVGGAISASRVDLNRHYLSDVIAGAGIGFFFSSAVNYYHERIEKRHLAGKSREKVATLVPFVAKDSYGLAWSQCF